jgi:hypothetical protein
MDWLASLIEPKTIESATRRGAAKKGE